MSDETLAADTEALAEDALAAVIYDAVLNNPRTDWLLPTTRAILASDWFAGVRAAERAAALEQAANQMPAFHDRDAPEWAITSACKWLRKRAASLRSGEST